MAEYTARIFRNGRNQAIRIPVELSLAADQVTLERRGDALIVRPVQAEGWDRFFSDESLVLPQEFSTGEDLPPADRRLF